MSLINKILNRAKNKSALYDLYPELQYRIPIFRAYSDQAQGYSASSYQGNLGFYQTQVWVSKAIAVLKNNLTPLYVRVVEGEGQDAKAVDSHPFTQLLQAPNSEMGAADFWEQWLVDMMLGGESGIEVEKGNKLPLALWPVQPNKFYVRPDPAKRRYRAVSAYKIDDGEGEPYTLTPEEFLHFKFYNPLNPWRGLAVISAIRTGIIIDQLAQAWTRLFFKNQARPDYALIAPEGLTESERREYREKLLEFNTGEGLHEPIILEQGVTDVKPLNWAPKDLEWLEQRRLARDEIGAMFGVPDEIMGFGRDTYENFATADRVLWTLTIQPLGRFRDRGLSRWAKRHGYIEKRQRVETDFSKVPQLQDDISAKIEQLDRLAQRGYPVNDLNQFLGLGLPDISGGDVGYMPLNMIPVSASTLANDDKAAKPRSKLPKWRYGEGAPDYGSEEHKALLNRRERIMEQSIARLQRDVKRFYQRQQNDVTVALRNSRSFGRGRFVTKLLDRQVKDEGRIPPVNEIFDLEGETEKMQLALKQNTAGAVENAGQAELDALGLQIEFDLQRIEVVQGYEQILRKTARKTQDRVWLQLIGLFEEAESEGASIPDIMERLSAFYMDLKTDWQTERVARTVTVGASNLGSTEGWRQSEVVQLREWVSALIPERSRDEHMAAHGQQRGLDESFLVWDELLQYPGDPEGRPENIINCLCTLAPIVA